MHSISAKTQITDITSICERNRIAQSTEPGCTEQTATPPHDTVIYYIPGSSTVSKEIPLAWELFRDFKQGPVSKGW